MSRFYSVLIFILLLSYNLHIAAQNQVSKQIMQIGRTDNRTMKHLDVLTNRIGARPIGSDAYENATYWVAGLLKSWGLEVEIQPVATLKVGFNR